MSRVRFLQIFWVVHVGNDTTNESNGAIKRTKKVQGVIQYIEKQFPKYFSLYALVAPTFEENSSLSGSVGIINLFMTWLRKFFKT
jgi:hypothetical protein